jgi:hypothetical protein
MEGFRQRVGEGDRVLDAERPRCLGGRRGKPRLEGGAACLAGTGGETPR